MEKKAKAAVGKNKDIVVANSTLPITIPGGEDFVDRVVQFVEKRYYEIETKLSYVNTYKVALMTAVSIAEEYLREAPSDLNAKEIENRLDALIKKIESGLE